jgi:hypothetical protein
MSLQACDILMPVAILRLMSFPIDESWVKIKNRTVGISSVTGAVHNIAPKITTLHIKQRGNEALPGKSRNILLSLFYNRSQPRNERLTTKSYVSSHFQKSGGHLVELNSSSSSSERIG